MLAIRLSTCDACAGGAEPADPDLEILLETPYNDLLIVGGWTVRTCGQAQVDESRCTFYRARCKVGHRRCFVFDTTALQETKSLCDIDDRYSIRSEPSEILDAAEYLLAACWHLQELEERCGRHEDVESLRREAQLALSAIDEVLKFYPRQGDLPPIEAFRSEITRRDFERSPETYRRERILGFRHRVREALRDLRPAPRPQTRDRETPPPQGQHNK